VSSTAQGEALHASSSEQDVALHARRAQTLRCRRENALQAEALHASWAYVSS
jgi:hypothetical protein